MILQNWKEIFAWLPVETLVHEHQEEYYEVLGRADHAGDSTEFVEFMLRMIRDALKEISENQNNDAVINVATNVVTNEDIYCGFGQSGKFGIGQTKCFSVTYPRAIRSKSVRVELPR